MNRTTTAARPGMGYQPGLDGLRAISVIAVILYHAGFTWMHGGFLGVEVFFVVSGFLITTLLIEEREKTKGVSLQQFWMRRIRRLFPALFAMLAAVAVYGVLFASAEQTARLRRDLPWSIFYVANWGQVVGDVPYFQAGDPPLLRHLWSLAVEEQWYLIWPFAFLLLAGSSLGARRSAQVLAGAAASVVVLTWWVQRGYPAPTGGVGGLLDGHDRINFNYLSTITRSSGLLLGAAAAYVWRPWRSPAAYRVPNLPLDVTAGVTVGVLVCAFGVANLQAGYMYPWVMLLVSVLSLVAVLIVVHPSATGTRTVLSQPLLVEIGKRSYGWYLWHWPIFVIAGATKGSWGRFVIAAVIALLVAEASYRYVEEPVRRGALRDWWRAEPARRWTPITGGAVVAVALLGYYATVDQFDVAVGGDEAVFDASVVAQLPAEVPAAADVTAATTATVPVGEQVPVTTAPVTAAPAELAPLTLPRRLSIVGDSQAHSLAVNLPAGIEGTFTVRNFSLDGCSVYDSGSVLSARTSFKNSFESICGGWARHWADSVSETDAEVVLVVLGAWDVFDLQIGGAVLPFASPDWDQNFLSNLQRGLSGITSQGANVALLEVACMRPVEAKGAGVPPLPERADDSHVAHVNDLLRSVAAADSAVTFVEGPDAWCNDEAIATDVGYRWDGVHVYKPGAKLIFDTIAPALLEVGR